MPWAGMTRAFGAKGEGLRISQKQIPVGNDSKKSKGKNSGIHAADGVVPRWSFRSDAVRWNRAHLAYKLRNCKLLKLSCFQHSLPRARRSPGIVLRGTIPGAAGAVRQEADSRWE